MDQFPIDMNHPTIREYLALVRLQVLTPLSLLINIAAITVCATVSSPTIREILKLYPTAISPKPAVILVYVCAIFAGQLGYCLLLVIARKDETKKTLTKGVGLSLVLANWAMALWAIAWVMQWFNLSTILQGVLLLLLIYSNVVLLIYHAPTSKRPLDIALIHAPLRFFLVLQLGLMFPLSLFVQLGLKYTPSPGAPGNPVGDSDASWPAFGVVLGTNILGLVVVALRRDIVWACAATWIAVSLWSERPKPSSVFITAIVFTVLHPLALFGAYVYAWFFAEKQVALPEGDGHPGLYPERMDANPHPETAPPTAREIDTEAEWS